MSDNPHIYFVRKRDGIAGQFAVEARVGYPGEAPRDVTFIGSTYGGPVVMNTGMVETFVSDPGRFGTFGVAWARRFFGEAPADPWGNDPDRTTRHWAPETGR
jgi:hypothetical protein